MEKATVKDLKCNMDALFEDENNFGCSMWIRELWFKHRMC